MRSWRILFLLLIFSLHCTAPIELEFESNYEPKITVFTEFIPDTTWSVQLIQSVAYTDSLNWNEYTIEDASVTIHSSSEISQSLSHIGNGVYQSLNRQPPMSDTRYTIMVHANDFPIAQGSSETRSFHAELMDIQEISSADTTVRSFQIRIRIHDPTGQDRYSLKIDHLQPVCRTEDQRLVPSQVFGGTRLQFVYFDSDFSGMRESVVDVNDPSGLPSIDEISGFSEAYFSDHLFEGTSKIFTLMVNVPHYQALSPHIRISMTNWSHELWSYQEYLEVVYLYGANYFEEAPKVIYSNIDGGLGVFGGKYMVHLQVDDQGRSWNTEDLSIGDEFIQVCDQS